MDRDIAPMRPFMQVRKTAGMRIAHDDVIEHLPAGGSIVIGKTPKSLLLEAEKGVVKKLQPRM